MKKNIPFTHTPLHWSWIPIRTARCHEVYREWIKEKKGIKDSVLAAITDITRTPKSPATSLIFTSKSCCNTALH